VAGRCEHGNEPSGSTYKDLGTSRHIGRLSASEGISSMKLVS
jgi:hypothetical protein